MTSSVAPSLRCLAVVSATFVVWAEMISAQQPPRPSGGDGLLYIGGYPNVIWMIDEATEKTIGTIQTKSGIPRRLGLSRDLTRFRVRRNHRHRVPDDRRHLQAERGEQTGAYRLARTRSDT